MRAPLLLAALSLAASGPAFASSPAPTPPTDCAAYLLLAPAGRSTSCGTLGGAPEMSGATRVRDLRLTVLSGRATATLTCYGEVQRSATVTLDGPGTAARYVIGDGNCIAVATATDSGTTAVVSNTSGYIFT